MAKNGVTVVTDKIAQVLAGLAVLATTRVMVGIPEEKNDRNDDSGITNAEIGYIHENGAPEVGIPARPHLVPGVAKVQDKIEAGLANAGKLALEGKTEGVMRQLNAIGLIAQSSIRGLITAGLKPPLKPGTIAARRRRGRTGTKPLIDTGQYRNAITYVIRLIRGK